MRYQVRKATRILRAFATGAALMLCSAVALAGTPNAQPGCGVGAVVVGSDTAGKVTLGSQSGTCVLTFSTPFANAPACMAMNETNGGAHAVAAGVKTTASELIVDGAAPWSDGDTIAYICASY